ncbi:TPR repeat-containing protein YrrB [bacterium BMS3Abin05]|nr:TPR repeat-containing protein YrrB [bacterium BMS3Abin05]GBE26692.1 TPR repeat-containing protein YrrB [bacterium BMS3Bbin03]HDL77961.1 tetratricopeptide repeat protein [Bacteroidota bacterium]HDZ12240.1 tetratricopeptide repeat protein [Bacteroidota bacterium]
MAIFLITNGLTALFFLALVGIGLYWKNRPAAVVNFIGFLIIAASVYLEIQGLQNRVTLFAGMTSIGIILLANILLAITMIRRNSKADWQWQQNWNAYSKQVDYKMIFVENAFKEELDLHENEGMTEKLQALQMWKLGNEAYWNKSFTDALEKYDFSLKWEPTSVAWINKSGILNELERFNEAIHACDEAIKLNQERIEAWLNRGFAYDHLHQSDKAIKSFDEALLVDKTDVEAWTNRGNSYRKLGKFEEAMESYDKALAIKDDYLPAWYNKGLALSKMNRIEEALVCFSQAAKIDSSYFMAYYNLGNCYNKLDRNEEAVAAYTKVLKLAPDFNEAWNNLGIALSKLGQLKEAIKNYVHAIEIKPDYYEAWINQALAYESIGDAASALKSYERFLELAPEDLKKHIAIAGRRTEDLRKKLDLNKKQPFRFGFSLSRKKKEEVKPENEADEVEEGNTEAALPQS